MDANSLPPSGFACEALPTTRKEAQAAGAKTYFTGKPCKHGHIAPRRTLSKVCSVCAQVATDTWRKANSDRVNEQSRARYRDDLDAARDRKSARMRSYRKREALRLRPIDLIRSKNRYALRKGADGSYSSSDIGRIRRQQRDRCAICTVKLNGGGHNDHIVALAKGGSNWPRNIQLLCRTCNSSKKAFDPIVYMRSLGRLL